MELSREKKIELIRKEFGIKLKDLYLKDDKIYLCGKPLDKWHREMWDWIAESGDAEIGKCDFVSEHFDDKNVIELLNVNSYCFGCLYVDIVEDKNSDDVCDYCPLCDYKENRGCCNGLYVLHVECLSDPELRKEVARHIANLEWEWK